jgi:hypothetical protein
MTPVVYEIKIAPKVCVRVSEMAPNPLSYQGGSSSISHNFSENQKNRFQYMIIVILNNTKKEWKDHPETRICSFTIFSQENRRFFECLK